MTKQQEIIVPPMLIPLHVENATGYLPLREHVGEAKGDGKPTIAISRTPTQYIFEVEGGPVYSVTLADMLAAVVSMLEDRPKEMEAANEH